MILGTYNENLIWLTESISKKNCNDNEDSSVMELQNSQERSAKSIKSSRRMEK
jgi:hypothetical protein